MKNNKFKIVIPSYNNEKWIEYNIASILNQTYNNYDVLYIDDCSTDDTYNKVVEIVGLLPNWTVVRNSANKRRGHNVSPYNTDIIKFIDSDEDILVFVDGDDWLFEDETLLKVNNYYNAHNVWMTYGQYINYPSLEYGTRILHGTEYSDNTHKHKLYRSDIWRASHLRTFKWHLYKRINKKDLLFENTGEHYIYAEDLATSFPCMEMAGQSKIGVVDFITYVYNSSDDNRERILNDLERDPNGYEIEMKSREYDIRSKNSYETINTDQKITSKLYGGLGNMLFQVAAGYSLAKKHNIEYVLYPEHSSTLHTHPKDYLKNIFSKISTIDSISNYDIVKERRFEYDQLTIYGKGNFIIDGHFQSYKYFEDYLTDIIDLFSPTQDIVNKLSAKYDLKNTISLHVRRGNYVSLSNYHHNLSLSYYQNAIDSFYNYNVLIFSDDINWCRENFKGDKFTFSEGNTDIEDLYLMSLCEHNIIANSTFSWWASMLNKNKNKRIIYPDKWFGPLNKSIDTSDLMPKDWMCLSENR
jgi:glycosyltransferase involved in cell wall biosynthesis